MEYQGRKLDNQKLVEIGVQGVDFNTDAQRKLNILPGCVAGNYLFVAINGNEYDVLICPKQGIKEGKSQPAKLATKQLIKKIEDLSEVKDKPVILTREAAPTHSFERGPGHHRDRNNHQRSFNRDNDLSESRRALGSGMRDAFEKANAFEHKKKF